MDRLVSFLLIHLPEIVAFGCVLALQLIAALFWMWRTRPVSSRRGGLVVLALALSSVVLAIALVASTGSFTARVPRYIAMPVRAFGLSWAALSTLLIAATAVRSAIPRPAAKHSAARRAVLATVRNGVVALPAVAAGYAVFIERRALQLAEVAMPIPGLPRDLDGLRLVQLTDIHLSPYLSRKELRRAVDMANETKAHIALVTGDLITAVGDPLDDCLAELKRLRADAGVFGCHGNHENYSHCADYATREGAKVGIRFLRHQNATLRMGAANLNLVGVDYQPFRRPYLAGTERLMQADAVNVLLSHNPDVFPIAAQQGFQLTLSGHTHGGQITVEILDQNLSVARFYTPFVYGVYRQEKSSIYVGRGIGTVGLPARLGAPPEVALVRLCAI